MRTFIRRSILFVCSIVCTHALAQQHIARVDQAYATIPFSGWPQGMASEEIAGGTLIFYIAFDDSIKGFINVYSQSNGGDLVEIRSLPLPHNLKHANDIQLHGDSLLITGWKKDRTSDLGWIDKHAGRVIDTMKVTAPEGKWLQFSFVYRDTVFVGVSNESQVSILKYVNGNLIPFVENLRPSSLPSASVIIQGSKVVGHYLVVQESSPTRMDIYDLSNHCKYIRSYYGEYDAAKKAPESEGLGYVHMNKKHVFFSSMVHPGNPMSEINAICIEEGQFPSCGKGRCTCTLKVPLSSVRRK